MPTSLTKSTDSSLTYLFFKSFTDIDNTFQENFCAICAVILNVMLGFLHFVDKQ